MNTEISPYDAQLNNPLLGFLTDQPRGPEIKEALLKELLPPPGELERSRPPKTRLRYLNALRGLHIPLNRDLALWELLLDLLEDSYASRCPTPARILYEQSVLASFPSACFASENDIEAIGIALIGMSGVGKSRTLKRLLRRIVQVIRLPIEENPLLAPLMITWLRVECPANRSLISLANAIIRAIEKATNEPIPEKYKTGNKSVLVQKILSYQFTKGVVPYEAIEPTLYDLSQGLPSLAVMLWRLSQRYAILMEMDGSDTAFVTTDIMIAAYDDYFGSVRPMVDALRSSDPALINLYEDLHFDAESLEEQLAKDAATEAEAARIELLKTRRKAVTKAKRIINTTAMAQAAAVSMVDLPTPETPTPLLDAFDKAQQDGDDPAAGVVAAK